MNKLFAVLLGFFILVPVYANVYHFFNGEGLAEAALEWEKSQSDPKQADLFLVSEFAGYVGGLFDHLSEKQHICAPNEITKNDVLHVVAESLKVKRKGLKNAGSVTVESILYKAYTCTK